jgi:hypothetical protein
MDLEYLTLWHPNLRDISAARESIAMCVPFWPEYEPWFSMHIAIGTLGVQEQE